ncbi:olfactory receptor 5V1-like [Rhinatrema bivittatum]|uniref:olfactory receptor 5V1-like n=1 Tax=Rhinatrema bivittatum TaxID=194408 RepID=UPI00112D67F1|nr:olfactory receptor 5V1-like [Rhinatrema bivittatum]
MEIRNQTTPSEFIIMGFSGLLEYQTLLFGIFLVIYIVTLLGNTIIIVITRLDFRLHMPMYFFLGNLSFIDICYTSTTLPKMLEHLTQERKTIPYSGCVMQLYFFVWLLGSESFLLTAMAYDRYVAICNPLRYKIVMNKIVCWNLVTASWIPGLVNASAHAYFTFRLPFCSSNKLNYFFCDIPPLLLLSCADTSINDTVMQVSCIFIGWVPCMFILVSYFYIIRAILRITSSSGRHKAFSTCSSHLTVVVFFHASATFSYMRPTSSYSLNRDQLIPLLFSYINPMLNPFIYTLKNKDVKKALKRAFTMKTSPSDT